MESNRPRFVAAFHRFLSLFLMILIAGALPAAAQDCEIPLFVQQSLVGANLMILVDNSGSMNTGVYHLGYDPDVEYSGRFWSDATYFIYRDGDYSPSDFNSTWPSYPEARLVDSDMGQMGQYPGNYLNWVYEHATDEQRDALPEYTRIQLMKEVLADVISRSTRLRIGLTNFYQNQDGGNILAYCEGGNELAVLGSIDAMVANSYTQLGEAMETIGDYFKESQDIAGAAGAVIEYPCQYNFCLVVTDGLPTMDVGVSSYLHDADGDGRDPGDCESIGSPYSNIMDCSDHFDDVCYALAHDDLRPDLEGDQFLYTYVVGFHEKSELLQDAAANGGGLFFHASNYEGLVRSIDYAIQDILRRISGGSAVAVVSTERGDDDRLYRGKFMPVDWDGYLECFALPLEEDAEPVWEAGSLLAERDPGDRDLFTAIGSTYFDFTDGSAAALQNELGAATIEEAGDLINWGRGEEVEGLRDRHGWILGDIVHSTPVVVGDPSLFAIDPDYQTFAENNADRRKMVYVGGNDGILHAFDATDGEEVWGFVPQFALPDFAVMADSGYCHAYTCDQTSTIRDMKLDGRWKTVLVSNGREGGSGLFALDVTDPEDPDVLWQEALPDGKDYASRVKLTSIGGTATALVGSGLDESTGLASLYSYRVSDGYRFGSLPLGTTRDRNKATQPCTVDLNMDGEDDLVYIADVSGCVWRIELNGSPSPSAWNWSKLYEGDRDCEITADPVAAFGANGTVLVYFGTGAYLTEDDMLTLEPQKFVCVVDHHDRSTLDDRDLANQTYSIEMTNPTNGWYVELWNAPGERVTETALVVAETVVFTSFAPSMNACVAGGESWLYQLGYDDGGLPPDAEEDGDLADRSSSLGEGIASYPVMDLANGNVVVQSSDASIEVEEIAATYSLLRIKAWKESFSAATADESGDLAGDDQGEDDDD